MKQHNMKLSEPWYSLIKNNTKTIEGRIYDDKRKLLHIGDILVFTDTEGKKPIQKKIKDLKIFKNFDIALREAKLKNILPGIKTYKEGIQLYHSIKGYKEGAKKHGVVLIYI